VSPEGGDSVSNRLNHGSGGHIFKNIGMSPFKDLFEANPSMTNRYSIHNHKHTEIEK
jgi:hypothetical protein